MKSEFQPLGALRAVGTILAVAAAFVVAILVAMAVEAHADIVFACVFAAVAVLFVAPLCAFVAVRSLASPSKIAKAIAVPVAGLVALAALFGGVQSAMQVTHVISTGDYAAVQNGLFRP